uniref:Admp n=1 Tax=Ptychodera flava TaxID=63121 RepID=A0A0K0VHF2_PTYFL|nr:Admp [Ptychodera flava]
MELLKFFSILAVFLLPCSASPVQELVTDLNNIPRRMDAQEEISNVVREQAIEQLSEVFGIPRRPQHRLEQKSPPQFMMDLYRSVADDSGITKASNPYHANIIRSFPNKGQRSKTFFYFNVSSVPALEDVLQAELHLYKLKPKGRLDESLKQHFFEVHVHQLLSDEFDPENTRLIGARLVSAHGTGWEVFSITPAVTSWLHDPSSNYGLMVTVTTMTGMQLTDNSVIRFAKKKEHHGSKQPILVVFTNDGRPRTEAATIDGSGGSADYDYTYDYIMQTYGVMFHPAVERHRRRKPDVNTSTNRYQEESTRQRRAAGTERPSDPTVTRQWKSPCSRQKLYVDFEEIGWSGWIIAPRGYNAYHCKGECPFPLGQTSKPTNHATVQSIVNALSVEDDVSMPCCVPDKLVAISLLYFDEDDNVILKQYDDMVAASCGCH